MNKLLTCLLLFLPLILGAQTAYQTPPAAIADLVNAPQTPAVILNGSGDWMLLLHRPGYKSIEELAQPELRLAGLRLNPRTNGSSRGTTYAGITFKSVDGKQEYALKGLPENAKIQNVSWSPDNKRIAFTLITEEGIQLWCADFAKGQAQAISEAHVNDILRGLPYQWYAQGQKLIYRAVLPDRGPEPAAPLAPKGPTIQETTGKKAPVRTYQDLLQNAHDETLFDYYAQGQLLVVDTETQSRQAFGKPGIISQLAPSPDDNFVLVTYVKKPFSYIVPYRRFPLEAVIYDRQGNLVKQVADIPLAENIPKGFGAVRTGPRNFMWRHDVGAVLYWVEAQDGGDPAAEVEERDQLFYLEAPFTGEKKPDVSLKLRFGGVSWGDEQVAMTYSWWWNTRQSITASFSPGDPESRKVVFDVSFEDRYNDPGNFETARNRYGKTVLLKNAQGQLYLRGQGASPEGNRPFVRTFDLSTKKTNELWRSKAPYYEFPVRIINAQKGLVLTRRESKDEPPNYFLRDLRKDRLSQVTSISHPYPQLAEVEKQVVQYTRKDGVALKGDLYLPPGYDKAQGTLPVIMWAYPNEFKSADAASQVEGSPYEFIRLGWWSPLYFLTRGYAIFDDPSMPVIGEGEEEPNDSFRSQLVMNAEAAIDKLADMGIADRERIAIGGHSYGAFMTANLLAHSDLFAGGIARSGAYNRTLTPFGFQAEERTYWEAPEVYYTMSPFMHAEKVNEPILLIHGEADNNSGTFPIQSKRYFAALKGLGGQARLVMLPHESHGYRAKESILHMLWEMDQFLEKYVKEKAPKMEEVELETGK